MIVDWGAAFAEAYKAASHAAKIVARQALVTTQKIAENIVGTVRVASQVAGEIVNTVGGLTIAAGVTYARAMAIATRIQPGTNLLVQPCPGKAVNVFNNSYRSGLLNSTFAGAGDKNLAAAMLVLAGPILPTDPEQQLRIIAESRRRPLADIKSEYEKFIKYRVEIEDGILKNSLDPIEALLPNQSHFMGSEWQLRYGKVAGDHLGIDPVFASLLNPTGGLVGPGNAGLEPASRLVPEAVAYHGAYHDAMGFIFQYRGAGPGYNYMKSPFGLDTGNPMAGQATGIMGWTINLARSP